MKSQESYGPASSSAVKLSYGTHTPDKHESSDERRENAQQSTREQGSEKRGRIGAVAEARQEKRPDLVLVEWVDSFGCSPSWENINGEPPSPLICRSVGWLLHDTPACKVIVPHLTQPNGAVSQQGCGDMTIPTRAVLSVTKLSLDTPMGL